MHFCLRRLAVVGRVAAQGGWSFLKMAVGAGGCLLKQPSAHLLPEAIRKAMRVFFGWMSSDAEARGSRKVPVQRLLTQWIWR